MKRWPGLIFGAAVILAVVVVTTRLMQRSPSTPQQAGSPPTKAAPAGPVGAATQVITKGEYLARAGDCVACHTEPNGKPFAGGRPMATPFGNLYVPNITPDDKTGIGRWSADEFYKMMHIGVSRDGILLYPAMPFASYTKVTREARSAGRAWWRWPCSPPC